MAFAAFTYGPANAQTPSGDVEAPTAPDFAQALSSSSSQINLTWIASYDNVGVTSYLIERCLGDSCTDFVQIGTSTTASYSDTGLLASTWYTYRVRASDAANNLSDYSGLAITITDSPPDTQAPTTPSNLTATGLSSGSISLSWTPSTDDVGVTAYRVERCQGTGCSSFSQVATSTTATFRNNGLTPATTYRYRVRAADAASNVSAYSNEASAATQAQAQAGADCD